METKKPLSHITAGLIIGGVLVLLALVRNFMFKEDPTKLSAWIDWLLVFAGLILFVSAYAKAKDHDVTYGNLFVYGFKITAVFTIVMLLFMVLINIIDPDIRQRGFDLAREKMMEEDSVKEEDVDRMMGWMENYYWPITIGGTILGHIVMGCIGSLIAAAIPKKQPKPAHLKQMDQLDS